MEMNDLFRVPGQGGPYNIDSITSSPLISTAIHTMITFEVTDDRFDFYPLLHGSFEPCFPAVRVRCLSLLGNGDSLYSPSSAAVLLLLGGLIEPSISGELLGRLPRVRFDSGDQISYGLHIGDVVLILSMGKDQAVVILREGYDGAELTIRMALPLLDYSHVWFMQRVDPILGSFAGEHLSRLFDNSLSNRDQTVEFPPILLEAATVKTVCYPGGLLDHMAGHLFEFFDRLFPGFFGGTS